MLLTGFSHPEEDHKERDHPDDEIGHVLIERFRALVQIDRTSQTMPLNLSVLWPASLSFFSS